MNKFEKHLRQWVKENPNHPESQMWARQFAENEARKREEKQRWQRIGFAMEHYDLRGYFVK